MGSEQNIDLKFGANLKDFRKGISNIDRSLKNLSGGFNALGGVIGASFAVDAIKQFVSESVQLGATMQGVRQAFERFAEPGTLDELRNAVAGTVDDLKLMQMAVRAKNFKIPMDVLAKGLRFAQQRAVETGESVDYLVESFVVGLGRESVKILDNLGISTLEIQKKTKEVGDMTKAVGMIMDEEFGKAGGAIETASMKLDRQRSEITNLKIAIGEELQPVYSAFLENVKGGLDSINTLISDQIGGVERMAYIASFFQGTQGRVLRVYLDAQVAARKAAEQAAAAQNDLGNKTGGTTGKTEELTDAQKKAALKAAMLAHDMRMASKAMQDFVMFGEGVSGAVEHIEEDFEDTEEVFEDFQGNLDKIMARRETLQDGFMQMGMILRSTFQDAFRPLEEGETRMEAFTDAFSRMLQQMIVDLLATAAAAALVAIAMTIAFGGAGVAGAQVFGIQGGFGELFGQTFKGMGGLGFGGGFGGNNNNGGMNIMSIIRGQDLLLVQERAGRNRNRSTGIGG